MTIFTCTKCNKDFIAPDYEYEMMVFSVPQKCSHCRSMRTLPKKDTVGFDLIGWIFGIKKKKYGVYEDIWKRMEEYQKKIDQERE